MLLVEIGALASANIVRRDTNGPWASRVVLVGGG